MSAFYLCTQVPQSRLKPGKLVQSTDKGYAEIESVGGLLWPATDPYVAAAAVLAVGARKGQGQNDEYLQSVMISGVMQSLSAGGGAGWASGGLLIGGTNTLVVQQGVSGAVFNLTNGNAAITMLPGGTAPQTVTIGWTGTDNGFTGNFTSSSAILQATGFNGGSPSSSIPTGQVGGTTSWTWVPAANGGSGLWLKS